MRKTIVILLTIALLAAVVGPGIINRMYQASNPWIYTVWGAEDVLSYYGTIISAVISVLILALTIFHERENIVKERKYSDIQAVLSRAEESFHVQTKSLLDGIQSDSFCFGIFHAGGQDCAPEINAAIPDLHECQNVINELRQCNVDVEQLTEIMEQMEERSLELIHLRLEGESLRNEIAGANFVEKGADYGMRCIKFREEIHSIDSKCRSEFLRLRRIAVNM